MRERARRLSRPHRRVDPAIGEKSLGDARHLGREAAIGRQHHVPRLWPGDGSGRRKRQRCVAVPMRELLLFEPACLEPVVAMRQPRIGGANRTNQRIDHLALDAVVQMARIRDIPEAAPAIGNLLVLGQRIGHQRERPLIGLEGLRQRLRRRPALLTGAVLQQTERRLDRQFPSRNLEAQAGNGLIEQPIPGRVAALGFFMEQLLDAILELIRLVLAQVLDPGPIMPELGRLHRTIDGGILNPIEFEREEQQVQRRRRQALGDVAIKFGDRRIDAVAGMNQAGIGPEPAGKIVDRLVAPDGFGKPLAAALFCGPLRKPALVVGLKRDAFGVHPGEVARNLRRVDTGIEVGQIPFRQFPAAGPGR